MEMQTNFTNMDQAADVNSDHRHGSQSPGTGMSRKRRGPRIRVTRACDRCKRQVTPGSIQPCADTRTAWDQEEDTLHRNPAV